MEEIAPQLKNDEKVEDLIGILQDLYHRLDVIEDIMEYNVKESIQGCIAETLERYDAEF